MPLPSTPSSLDTTGGQHGDYHQQEDPTTDLLAAQFDQLSVDCSSMTRITRQAWVLFSGLTYTSGTQSIPVTLHRALWGFSNAVKPVVDQTATGVYHVTWPTTITDELGVVHTLNILVPENPVVYGADGLRAKVLSWTANVLTINAYSAGVLSALNGTQISVGWA